MVLPVRQQVGGLGNLLFKNAYIYAAMRNGEIPDVYVQSSKYWDNYSEEIRAMYSLGIKPVDAVALHIRRGDYLDNPFYVNLWETDYYQKAIALTERELSSYDGHGFLDLPHYIVFCRDNQGWESDKADRQWCRDSLTPLLGDRWELAPKENTESDDLNLMAGCTKGIVMANSSFSWWAAFLGRHEKIICPKQWHTDEAIRTDPLPEWTRL